MRFWKIFQRDGEKHTALAMGHVVPHSSRCVQCGICSYHCPVGIDVRAHVWRNEAVEHNHCLTCGECVSRCPRSVLYFKVTNLFERGGL